VNADTVGIRLQNTSDTDGNFAPIDFMNSTGYMTARIGAEFQDAGDRNTDLFFMVRANGAGVSEKMRITSEGKVGIGTESPGATLHVDGDIISNDLFLTNEGKDPNMVDGTNGSWQIQEGADDLFLINKLNGKQYRFKLEEMT